MYKAALLAAVLVTSPGTAAATPASPEPAPERHWILKLKDRAVKAGPDADYYRAMGQLIYTAQRRGTTLGELRAAKAAIEREENEQGSSEASEIIRGAVQILIEQHGMKTPAISAEGLGYEEFDERR